MFDHNSDNSNVHRNYCKINVVESFEISQGENSGNLLNKLKDINNNWFLLNIYI